MRWTLVVSEDETFQREAIARAGGRHTVGATGDSSARTLVRAVDVEQVLVDARDDVGKRFLTTLRNLPHARIPGVEVVVVGPSDPTFRTTATLADALTGDRAATRAA